MGVQWTKEQQKVIDLRNSNILVSAAAGSGKTAVLVERIITRLTKDASPLDVDRLLIVTFTEAAAAEMKERIGAALEKALEQEPENLPAQEGEQGTPGTQPADQTEKPVSGTVQKPSGSMTQKPSAPSTSKPTTPETQEPAQKPAEESGEDVDLAAFCESVTGSAENWPAMVAMGQESVDAFYPGLSDISTKQCSIYMAMISATVGEIALVQVENADDVQAVKDIFQARIDYQVGDENNPGGAWYPDTIEGWKNNSRIVSNGNYVMLVAVDGADSVVESFNALFA